MLFRSLVVTEPTVPDGGERAMMSFETITLAPFDRRLINAELLTTDEIAWVDAYHARVARTIGPRLSGADKAWLVAQTGRLAAG